MNCHNVICFPGTGFQMEYWHCTHVFAGYTFDNQCTTFVLSLNCPIDIQMKSIGIQMEYRQFNVNEQSKSYCSFRFAMIIMVNHCYEYLLLILPFFIFGIEFVNAKKFFNAFKFIKCILMISKGYTI